MDNEQTSPNNFKRKAYKLSLKYLENEKLIKLRQESESRSIIEFVNKKKKYSKLVSQAFKPKISQKKKRD